MERNERYQLFLYCLIYKYYEAGGMNYMRSKAGWQNAWEKHHAFNTNFSQLLTDIEINKLVEIFKIPKFQTTGYNLRNKIAYYKVEKEIITDVKCLKRILPLLKHCDHKITTRVFDLQIPNEEIKNLFEETLDFYLLYKLQGNTYEYLMDNLNKKLKNQGKIENYETFGLMACIKPLKMSIDNLYELYKLLTKFKGHLSTVKEILVYNIMTIDYKKGSELLKNTKSKREYMRIMWGVIKGCGSSFNSKWIDGKYVRTITSQDHEFADKFLKELDLNKLPTYNYLNWYKKAIDQLQKGTSK